MKKVSIIVPVYNVEKYLRGCLESLVNQTFKDIEIIVVNDGSPDRSQEIIDEYKQKYPSVIKSLIKENGGVASARNFGLKYAEGDYVTYVDSDDWVSKNMIEKMYGEVLKSNSDIVVCKSYSVKNGVTSEMIKTSFSTDSKINYILNEAAPWGKLIKKEIMQNADLQFPKQKYYEDIAIIPALVLYAKKVTYLDDCLYYYSVREGSLMNQCTYKIEFNDIFNSFEKLSKIFKKNNMMEKYADEFEWLCIEHLLHAASLRFLPYKEGEKSLNKINDIMKNEFPNWTKNKYYKRTSVKYKIVCELTYRGKYKILKKFLKIG